ncbi:histidine phosphatase family protein [Nocardioides gilvus]|uniref:histidine phosphatase family protein n=1 Tax=Nocardioides gilvus TaxID=1735589 RepID=UPI0013A56EA8|nr:histidine phosphatase family protein [Nocardioides gilvus]
MTELLGQPRRLLVLRHGQTAWNHTQRVQGQIDVPLDETGVVQAEQVAPVLAAMRPAFVRSSDLVRASATAERVAAAAGVPLVVDARLREFDLGERSGTTLSDYAASHPDEFAAYRAGHYDVVPGGESREDVVARFVPALTEALRALAPGELGVVVAHGAAIKVSLASWLGWAPETATTLHALGNCHWALVDDSGQAGVRRLVAFNRHV